MTDYKSFTAADFLLEESFINYCRNVNEADIAFWNNFQKENPDKQLAITQAKELYYLVAIKSSAQEKEMIRNKVQEGIMNEAVTTPVYAISHRSKKNFIWYAAAIVIAIVSSVALWNNFSSANKEESRIVANYSASEFTTSYQSGDDTRKEITLPDGTVVLLNYGSELKLAVDYDQSKRWVELRGEAFFSVKHNADKPFVVITGNTATTALGTSFKVRNYEGDNISTVMLATGKVKVQELSADQKVTADLVLMPGEAVSAVDGLQKSVFDLQLLENWRNANISFSAAGLDEIIKKLEFNYGIKMNLANASKKTISFTGKFHNKPLNDILEAIAFTNKFSYSKKGNNVSIQFQ